MVRGDVGRVIVRARFVGGGSGARGENDGGGILK